MALLLNGTDGVTFNDGSEQWAAASPIGTKNLIINGDMRIAQRGTSAAITNANAYVIDRFTSPIFGSGTGRFTAQQVSTAPTEFEKSLQLTVTTTDASPAATYGYLIQQRIEGYNAAHLLFGSASAKTITVSFWVRSSVTGSFGFALNNGNVTRNYGVLYTISAANTWEKKTITIVGDTTGTWEKTNLNGLSITFCLGGGSTRTVSTGWNANATGLTAAFVTGGTNLMATSGATFNITGVQLEVGDTATPFEVRPYDMELARCMRYYEKSGWRQEDTPGSTSAYNGAIAGPTMGNNTNASLGMMWKVIKRAKPTVTVYGSILDALETAGIIVDWNFGTSCGTATVFRVEDCGYNYISAPTATSYGHIYRIVANAEL